MKQGSVLSESDLAVATNCSHFLATTSFSARSVRMFLYRVFPSDSCFSAFCLDCFPEVYAEFTDGMTRTRKTTLLFSAIHNKHQKIAEQALLYDVESGRARKFLSLLTTPITSENPYRSLQSFQIDDVNVFFGRGALTRKLRDRYAHLCKARNENRILCILGPSGSGKSSVARAGLLASLRARALPDTGLLRVAAIKPGSAPYNRLADALHQFTDTPSSCIATRLQGSSSALHEIMVGLSNAQPSSLVLLVDQFEELYSQCGNIYERNHFVAMLLDACRRYECLVSVVITLRSDFLGDVHRHHPELAQVLTGQNVELVPPLNSTELREAITQPAEFAGLPIDDSTVENLAEEVRGRAGALPLMQFTLTRLFDGMLDGIAPGTRLAELGGVDKALAQEADRIYLKLDATDRATAKRAMLRLVELGEEGKETRRRALVRSLSNRTEAENDVLRVLRHFAEEDQLRLVSLGEAEGENIAELAHEALITHWESFREWLDSSREDRRLRKRASEAAQLWAASGRKSGRLWRSPDVDLFRNYAERNPDDLSIELDEFLSASLSEIDHERRQRRTLYITGILLLSIIILTLSYGYRQQRRRVLEGESAHQRDHIANERIRQQLLSSYVERGRQLLVEKDQPLEAALWLSRAYSDGATDSLLPYLLTDALRPIDALDATLLGHHDSVLHAHFSLDGKLTVTSSKDGTSIIWDAVTGKRLATLVGHHFDVYDAQFTSDGTLIVTAGADMTARVWNTHTGEQLALLSGHTGPVDVVRISFDGKRILTTSGSLSHAATDQTAKIWDTSSGRLLATLRGHRGGVYDGQFSPDGRVVATAGEDKTMRLWNSDTGSLIRSVDADSESLIGVRFNRDGKYLLSFGLGASAFLWDVQSGRLVTQIGRHTGAILGAEFSFDDRFVLTRGTLTAALTRLSTNSVLSILQGHQDRVADARFSPDNSFVITASNDRTARLWHANSGYPIMTFFGHRDAVRTAEFSPDGRRIITSSNDGTAKLWNANAGKCQVILWSSDEKDLHVNSKYRYASNFYRMTISPHGNLILKEEHISSPTESNPAPKGKAAPLGDKSMIIGINVDIFDTGRQQLMATLEKPEKHIMIYKFSPDEVYLVGMDKDRHFLHIWESKSGNKLRTLDMHASNINSISFSPDGRRLITASDDKTACIWDLEKDQLMLRITDHKARLLDAKFSPDGSQIATAGSDGMVQTWDAMTGRWLTEFVGNDAPILSIDYSPNGRYFVISSGGLRIWNLDSGQVVSTLKGASQYLSYSQDSKMLTTTDGQGIIQLWDSATGNMLSTIRYGSNSRLLHGTAATFNSNNNLLLIRSDMSITLWEVASARLISSMAVHRSPVTDAVFGSDSKSVMSVAEQDGSMIVCDITPERRSPGDVERLLGCRLDIRLEGNGIVPRFVRPQGCGLLHPRF